MTITVQRGGVTQNTFTDSEILSFSWSASAPDIGFSGICTTSISVSLANKGNASASYLYAACQKGDSIIISYGSMTFPIYYVSSRDFGSWTTNFTAYDSCSKLEAEIDNSAMATVDNQDHIMLYNLSYVMSMLSTQAGISIVCSTDAGLKFTKDDVSGTIRSVLEDIAAITGGMWVCTTLNTIQFVAFESTPGTDLLISDYSELLIYNAGTTISSIIVYDTTIPQSQDNPTTYGSGTVFKYIQSKLIHGNPNVGGSVYQRIMSKSYSAFTMTSALVASGSFTVPLNVRYGAGYANSKTALSVTARLTAAGFVCELTAPEMEDETDRYKNLAMREDQKSVKKGENLGVFFVDNNICGMRRKISDASSS